MKRYIHMSRGNWQKEDRKNTSDRLKMNDPISHQRLMKLAPEWYM
jgi:hypothetical protein